MALDEENREFFTAEEVATMLQVNKVSVYRLLTNGQLPYHQFGKLKRIRRADLEAFLSRSRKGGKSDG